ncbi:uncharacterized protein LOC115627533 isoform X3 [Scaptodrosophila lebanonensis]|uniref:Uncharacterized protein LOC115627533 isoform X3 n=1 Tax=Drosophila lebanonensis TaxID=7225 RepID=A0A6J2TU62_DROLE|nr:uncharacterized protein LOC115627533 isoform X3 [Scaptodrosophila lebanonensis]
MRSKHTKSSTTTTTIGDTCARSARFKRNPSKAFRFSQNKGRDRDTSNCQNNNNYSKHKGNTARQDKIQATCKQSRKRHKSCRFTSNNSLKTNENNNKSSSGRKMSSTFGIPSRRSSMFIFLVVLFVNACLAGTIPATPENITVTFLTPTSVRVSWQTMIDLNAHPIEKYIVTYKPTDDSYRVVQDVAGNSEAIVLDRLLPSTQYSLAVTAIWLGKKYRSRQQIIFKTLDLPKNNSQQDLASGGYGNSVAGRNANTGTGNGSAFGDDVTSTATNTLTHSTTRELPTIRGVEIGIVLIVLMVWAGAIALFFNRWGKIRMLLPYQPDYKHEQLKVPGTGVCSAGGCNGQHSHQHIHMLAEEHSTSISERCTRSRINSAIFVSSEGRGFDSIEFLRRHGSQSVLCRKAKSAENITDNGRKKSFSDKRQWRTDDESARKQNTSQDSNDIELKECGGAGGDLLTLPVLNAHAVHDPKQPPSAVTTLLARSAAITTANVIVGSISLEAPPPYMQDDDAQSGHMHSEAAIVNEPSQDSAETVEELVQVSLLPNANATATITPSAPSIAIEAKPRVLVHQRSSTASSSPHSSPKQLGLKIIKPKISAVPMVSVSGPSPPIEKPPLAECL